MAVLDGGPAGHACSCGQVGRYGYGTTRTARCANPRCPVIAYHCRPAPGTPAYELEGVRAVPGNHVDTQPET